MKRIRASASNCRRQNMSSGWKEWYQIEKTISILLPNGNKRLKQCNASLPETPCLFAGKKSMAGPVDKVLYWRGEEVKPVDRLSVWEGRGSLPYIHCGPPPHHHRWAVVTVDADVTLPMHGWGETSAWHRHDHQRSWWTHLSTPFQSGPFVTEFLNLFHFPSSRRALGLFSCVKKPQWNRYCPGYL